MRPEISEVYPGPIYDYREIWIASMWNSFRTCRILFQAIILNCAECLADSSTEIECYNAKAIIQAMAKDVCATVPFLLGRREEGTEPAELVIYPHIRKSSDLLMDHPLGHNRSGQALGGYTLIWPLFVAKGIRSIPDVQRR